jgi:hypothetical protein
MLEIIALIFLCKQIGETAKRKAEKPGKWKLITIGAWFLAELIGFALGAMLLGTDNIIGLVLLALVSAVGGYLIVKAQLDKLPDALDDDIDNIGRH